MIVRRGRRKFVTYKIQLGLDQETTDALLCLAKATGQSPNGAARYAIKQMARALQVSAATLQATPALQDKGGQALTS